MKQIRTIVFVVLASAAAAAAEPQPFFQDPIGPMIDVTDDAAAYQPATTFCIKPNVVDPTDQLLGVPTDQTTPPSNPDCAASIAAGLAPSDAGDLYKGHVTAPPLCKGCRRIFFDYSQIPANDPASYLYYAHGHIYFRLNSFNPYYTVDPVAHSPNVKNFTNDKLVAPHNSPQEQLAGAFELHAIDYVTDTRNFVHTASQGPYYIGPWYLSRNGDRIHGVYLDVNVADATQWPNPQLNAIGYAAGFNSGGFCPTDDDSFYAGCFDW